MANKRQRKKAAKNLGSFEGQQYRGGRSAGTPNLKRVDGGLENQYGVRFTPEEKKALEQAVNTANRKRARMLEQEAKLPRMIVGKETGDTVRSLQLMDKESDFILRRKTKSLPAPVARYMPRRKNPQRENRSTSPRRISASIWR
mgnify:CR=1 FL=1